MLRRTYISTCFFFHDPAPTQIYTLSLHDALPICFGHLVDGALEGGLVGARGPRCAAQLTDELDCRGVNLGVQFVRSEEHTSELQSRVDLVCRLLLEKKKN